MSLKSRTGIFILHKLYAKNDVINVIGMYYTEHIDNIYIHAVLLILFAYEHAFSRFDLTTYMIRFGIECTREAQKD